MSCRDPVKKGQQIIDISKNTKPGALTGINSLYYQNAYPVTAAIYGLYLIRDPYPANLAPLRDGDFNCVEQRVIEHFDAAMKGHGLKKVRRQKITEWEGRVHETGATVDDVAELEHILKQSIVLRDIAGEPIYDSGKYKSRGTNLDLIVHNGHAWSADLHFPTSRQVHFYEGDVWQAIQEVTRGVWLLGGGDKKLSVDQFVLEDSRTYRTRETHERLQHICDALGDSELAK